MPPPQRVRTINPLLIILSTTLAVAISVVVLWLLFLARYAILFIYMSALLATGVSPIVQRIEHHARLPGTSWRPPRWLAILSVYLAAVAVVAGLSYAIFPPLIHQAQQLAENLPDMLHRAQLFLVRHGIEEHPLSLGQLLQMAPTGTDFWSALAGKFWALVGGFFGLIVIIVLSFYLLNESKQFFAGFLPLFPREWRHEVRRLTVELTNKVGSWMIGQIMLCSIIGATTAVGLGFMGIPYFYVLAVIAACGEFIPYAGPVLAALPGIAIGLTISWQTALLVAGFYLVQQQLENHVLVPQLMRHQVGLSSAGVIIAILVGTALLGILGAILAVPTAAVIQVVVQELGGGES